MSKKTIEQQEVDKIVSDRKNPPENFQCSFGLKITKKGENFDNMVALAKAHSEEPLNFQFEILDIPFQEIDKVIDKMKAAILDNNVDLLKEICTFYLDSLVDETTIRIYLNFFKEIRYLKMEYFISNSTQEARKMIYFLAQTINVLQKKIDNFRQIL